MFFYSPYVPSQPVNFTPSSSTGFTSSSYEFNYSLSQSISIPSESGSWPTQNMSISSSQASNHWIGKNISIPSESGSWPTQNMSISSSHASNHWTGKSIPISSGSWARLTQNMSISSSHASNHFGVLAADSRKMVKNTHSHDWEKRVAVIMQELESRQEGVAKSKVLNEIKNLIAGLSLQNIELAGKGTEEVNKNVNEGLGESHQPWGPIAKLEFPKFSGEGLESWLLHTEYFLWRD
ncbi:hypothetical protein GH714_003565 [Hevea brasiliensis]|uniref:Uncharacterized protein n=1 Tax=Hevea brasiliensis TaxID=3981 RepID=A0A6A6M754_HEVBR|nr:hypothetical protein GH714_003565 [Hevea brasiliensis]